RDNMTLNGSGYTIQGNNAGSGIHLAHRINVTIRNTNIQKFNYGIYIYQSSFTSFFENDLRHNADGFMLTESSNNSISGNIVMWSSRGIHLSSSLNNSIIGNNATLNGAAIFPEYSHYNNITQNSLAENGCGILFSYSSNNTVVGNDLKYYNLDGIKILRSSNNTFKNNTMAVNSYNFRVWGQNPSHFLNDVDVSNTVDGKPIYYWIKESDRAIPADPGYVALVNCTGISVKNLELTNNGEGVLLAYTTNSTIAENNITICIDSIRLYRSSDNTICRNRITRGYDRPSDAHIGIELIRSSNNDVSGNTIKNHEYGITLESYSSNNFVYHNNLIGNKYVQAMESDNVINFWDSGYPSGGNYWSDHTSLDSYSGPYQNNTGSDGIGDTPYVIGYYESRDKYPLMSPWSSTSIRNTSFTKGGENYDVEVISNVTVVDFTETPGSMKLSVTGESGTSGYVRIIQPVGLNSTNIKVFLNNTKLAFPSIDPPRSISTNGTHYFIYLAFTFNSAYEVIVAFPIEGDTDYDGTVNAHDVSLLAAAYGSEPEGSDWNPHVDIAEEYDIIDLFDLFTVATNYGETWPP
ncbi:MAG: nitrous oxide reductase family maturation protein NosD, partial [Promethearchaeota archaeon]